MSGYAHWDITPGMIYGFRLLGRAFVKIGCTRNLTRLRLQQLQSKVRCPLYVLGEMPVEQGLFRVEKRLKRMLAPYAHYGEWFAIDMKTQQFYALVKDAMAYCLHEERPEGRWYR